MGVRENKPRVFKAEPTDFRRAIHWLWSQRLPRTQIAELFQKSKNLVSVSVFNEEQFREERKRLTELPPSPNFKSAGEEIPPSPAPRPLAVKEREIDDAGVQFWSRVRSLEGLKVYGKLLQRLSEPECENIRALRYQARLKHLTAENYTHAGYAESAIHFANEAISMELKLFRQTRSKIELANYAKTALLLSRARIQREEWKSARATLRLVKEAFMASNVPIDPELYSQRAAIAVQHGNDDLARKLYKAAYDRFPAHRNYLGFGTTEHARYDVGQRPLGVLDADFERAEQSLEVSRAWPVGDIHHAINLNAAIATSLLSDSAAAKHFAEENFALADVASEGFGHQRTVVRLLELAPRISVSLRRAWIRFALNYNTYRNR